MQPTEHALIRQIINSEVVTVTSETLVREAIAIMARARISCVVIVEGRKPLGIFTERDIVKEASRGFYSAELPISELMSSPVITIPDDLSICEAYDLMLSNRIRHHVVVDLEMNISGVLTISDLIKHLGIEYFVEMRKIEQIMTSSVATVSSDTKISDALSRMSEQKISCVIVADGQIPVGVMTERDVARLLTDGTDLKNLPIRDVMKSPVQTVMLGTTVHEAATIMKLMKMRRVVVVDKAGKIKGITTQSDIVKGLEAKYIESLKQIIRDKEEIIRKTSEELLDKSVYLDNILNSSIGMAIIAADCSLTIKYFNMIAEKLLECSAECVIGHSVSETHALNRIMMDHLGNALEIVQIQGEYTFSTTMTKNGVDRFYDGRVTGILDRENQLAGYVLTFQDITGRKQAEEEKRALEQQFQQTQKLESLGVLAGGIAHDFNNLLAVIIGHCSLAKLRPESAEDNFKPIEKAAERAAELCQQMLAYAGKAQFIHSMIHLEALVDEMVKMSKSTIAQNVKITSNISSDVPPISADASQICQVTMNLIINASEAIGESQGEVLVSLSNRAISAQQQEKDHLGAIIPHGLYACLEVTDNGCGMDVEAKQRIFEPFYTTKFAGRGLGMSATLGIIKAHNGALQFFSKPGHGSTFKVYLPIQADDTTEVESLQQVIPTTSWQGDGTILLVEDEEQVICIAEAMLKELGFTVIKASNGEEALELYQKNAADIKLVVTDIGMPIMDGYTLIRELKKIDPGLPIIISSGFGDNVVTSKIASENISGLISKPYKFGKLLEVLNCVVGGQLAPET